MQVLAAFIAACQEELEAQQLLLQIVWEARKKAYLATMQRTALRNLQTEQQRVIGELFKRLMLWRAGGFLSLSSTAVVSVATPPPAELQPDGEPSGGDGDAVAWTLECVLRGCFPWLDNPNGAQDIKSLGCAKLRACRATHLVVSVGSPDRRWLLMPFLFRVNKILSPSRCGTGVLGSW